MLLNSKQITNIDRLGLAMTMLAIKDYKNLLKGKKVFEEDRITSKEEIETFFLSPEYEYMTGYNGKKIVSWLRNHMVLKKEKI